MPTSSIFHNIVLKTEEEVEAFLDAAEASANDDHKHTPMGIRQVTDPKELAGFADALMKKHFSEGDYVVTLMWDNDAKVWSATSDSIHGIVLESESYDALVEKVLETVPEIIELNNLQKAETINFVTEPFIRLIEDIPNIKADADNKNALTSKTKNRRTLPEIIGDWKAPDDYHPEDIWNRYEESLKITPGPVKKEHISEMKQDMRGIAAYARDKGVQPAKLSEEEKQRFLEFDSAFKDGRMTADYNENRPNYDIRAICKREKELGRSLTDEEVKEFIKEK